MIAAVFGVLHFLPDKGQGGNFFGFLAAFMALFVLSGIGNGTTFRMIPVIFRTLHERLSAGADAQGKADASRQAGARVLLVGMQMPPNYGPDYTARFARTYQDLARTNKVRLVPFMMAGFADKPDHFQQDGIHPTAEAQPKILDTIWRELKPLLR